MSQLRQLRQLKIQGEGENNKQLEKTSPEAKQQLRTQLTRCTIEW
jgi:hypothetical protein